jgi:hypothetical protein
MDYVVTYVHNVVHRVLRLTHGFYVESQPASYRNEVIFVETTLVGM